MLSKPYIVFPVAIVMINSLLSWFGNLRQHFWDRFPPLKQPEITEVVSPDCTESFGTTNWSYSFSSEHFLTLIIQPFLTITRRIFSQWITIILPWITTNHHHDMIGEATCRNVSHCYRLIPLWNHPGRRKPTISKLGCLLKLVISNFLGIRFPRM